MQFTFTPKAAQKVLGFISEKGGGLALRIRVGRSLGGMEWRMTLETAGPETMVFSGVPVVADKATLANLEGMVIDWVVTPQGPGFGVYNRDLTQRGFSQAAD